MKLNPGAKDLIKIISREKVLGVTFDSYLTFVPHADALLRKLEGRVKALKAMVGRKWGPSCASLKVLYQASIESLIRYGLPAWYYSLPSYKAREIQAVMSDCLRTITGCCSSTPLPLLFSIAELWGLDELYNCRWLSAPRPPSPLSYLDCPFPAAPGAAIRN